MAVEQEVGAEPVTQADREVAADIWRDYIARTGEIIVERNMRAGGLDDGLPAIIARHRLAHPPAPSVSDKPLMRDAAVGDYAQDLADALQAMLDGAKAAYIDDADIEQAEQALAAWKAPSTPTPVEEPAKGAVGEFKREERYIVIKRKNLSSLQEMALRSHMEQDGVSPVECVVVESDWPEYEPVWRMIEDRVASPSPANAVASVSDEQVDAEEAADLAADRWAGAHHDDLTPSQQQHWHIYRNGYLAALNGTKP